MGKEYDISRPSGACAACNRELQAGEPLVATVCESGEQLARRDFCAACWQTQAPADKHVLAVWHGQVPAPARKKRLFVDDELIVSFFERLADSDEPVKVSFRFVLALVLMRKKLLVYDGASAEQGRDVWRMHFKGSDQVHKVVDPHLDDEKIAQVSEQLGQVLQGEL